MRTLCKLLLLASAAVFSSVAYGQNAISSGALTGQVTDPSGAAVGGAEVAITNTGTSARQMTRTNAQGIFRFPILQVGNYQAVFSRDGFKTTTVDGIAIEVGATATANGRLELGAVSEQVTVSSEANTLDTTDTSVGTTVSENLIQGLPLSGRRYTDFVLLTPNAHADGEFGLVSIAGQQGGGDSGFANGNGSNSFTVDGATATSTFFGDARGRTRVPYVFGEQSIQEFQVSDNPYSAAYGGGGSGFINTVTKSGSNQFHGDAFYYNRNSGTGAEDAVDKANGNPKPLDVLQQFGADAGGPVLRDKVFFYFDYEQQREKDPISVVTAQQQVDVTSFGLPAGTALPAPNGPLPAPGDDAAPDPSNPQYLQQVSNALNAIQSNIGQRKRQRNNLSFFPKIDWQATSKDLLTFVYNYSRFDSPGGEITFNPESTYGDEALSNNAVRDHHASIHWVRTLSNNLLNDVHASYVRDEQIASPSGLVNGSLPSVEIFSPEFFELGNPGFALSNTLESEVEVNERVNWVKGRNTLDFGVDFNYDHVRDFNFGNFRGTYAFSNPANFAVGKYQSYSQSGGNPTFPFNVPYVGFYFDDKVQVHPKLVLDLGIREDFQVYPQPVANPAFPLTGQFPNRYMRVSPRFGFAYSPRPTTVLRGGYGIFYNILNGVNYENSVLSNGLPTQQSSAHLLYDPSVAPNQQQAVFPNQISTGSLFAASPNISLIDPHLHAPYVMQSSLQVEQQIASNVSFTLGTTWTHAVHLISSSAYDLNLIRPTGTTVYVVCPNGTPQTATACSGQTVTGPNFDNALLAEGAIDPGLGQINELISPGQNHYNALFAKLQSHYRSGLDLLASYTFSKNIDLDGVDFNNQFDFSNTHSPSLLDQRNRISVAGVYSPQTANLESHTARSLLSNWTFSTVMAFSSGYPYSGLLNAAAAGSNLNDSAANESTNNTAPGIAGSGPSPNIGLNSLYGPWIDEVDLGIVRNIPIFEKQTIQLKAQVFNVANHANYYVQNGSGINQVQYNPVGANCGDGVTQNQTCYLVPNGGPGNFGALQSVSQLNGPRVFQFAFQYSF